MENYHFATLDSTDVDDVRRLESSLAAKYGRNIVVVAYEKGSAQERQSSLSAGVEDDTGQYSIEDMVGAYSMQQTLMESGYKSEQ